MLLHVCHCYMNKKKLRQGLCIWNSS
uniref:Uncharacterized protein n=1 Tax=Arundo donax TaxID=35708 RepID=A0A0A8XY55_ARUDO